MIRLAACLAVAVSSTAVDVSKESISSGLSLPESVLQDAVGGKLYCSSIGGKEPTPEAVMAKDADGFISLLNPDGSVSDLRFLPAKGDAPLNGPKGLTLLGGQLWVADIDRVVGFDVSSRKELAAIDLSTRKVTFANDLVTIDDKRFLVSDTNSGQILAIEPGDAAKAVSEFDPPLVVEGANGLTLDGQRRLLVAQYSFAGRMLKVARLQVDWRTLKHGEPETLPFPDGQWDGLAVAKDGTVYASDWKSGAIWALKPDAKEATKVEGGDGFKGPADFWLLADESAIVCPDLVAQRVKVIKLKK
jgi:hypothetical protein